jgi:hypothetical protein
VAAIGLAALLALAPGAAARTLRVDDRTLYRDEEVRVSGAGWGTTIGLCAADPIELRLVRHRRSWPLARVGGLDVVPVLGTFARTVRMPPDVSAGSARIVATQREHVFGLGGCTSRPVARLDAAVLVHSDARSSCVEPECTPYVPVPRLGVDFLDDPIHPAGAFYATLGNWRLEPPPPVCDEPPCMRVRAAAARDRVRPGSPARLVGDDWEIPEGCPDRVRFRLLDRSGTGHELGASNVDPEGRFTSERPIPGTRVAPGAGTLFAATDSRDARCALVAARAVQVVPAPTLAWTVAAPAKLTRGLRVRIRGLAWGTDHCDGLVEILLRTSAGDRVVRRLRPGLYGAFDVEAVLPAAGSRLLTRQARRREIAGVRGLASHSKCARAVAPEVEPARAFPATLRAEHDPAGLHVWGFGWSTAACKEPAEVTVALVQPSGDRVLATIAPKEDGIDAWLPDGIEPGSTLRAAQPGCTGPGRSVTTTTRARGG